MCTERKYYKCFSCGGNIIRETVEDSIKYIDEHSDGCPMSEVVDKTPEFYEKLIVKCETIEDKKADIESKIKSMIKDCTSIEIKFEDGKDLSKLDIPMLDWIDISCDLEEMFSIKINKITFNDNGEMNKLSLSELVDFVELNMRSLD